MVHLSPAYNHSGSDDGFCPKRITQGLIISVASILALCKKHAVQASTKLKPKPGLARQPKRLLNQISNKTMSLMHHRKRKGHDRGLDIVAPDDFGDGGLWQREILMGDRCRPLDFSGVIYYDNTGKPLEEFTPRSQRASPLPAYLTRMK
ncbi:hypothetical protein HS088_TW15G00106 [Tripterygium wilfordii]|uniref:Uncharacterized protein n=1 Tax=Tripterygium wilfordii TaxID=458696 RepID=A0A7J7CKN3_TRIWF|nr:uncharacterized protein LOC120016732 [Tripterygium wilfordii]KAF5734614.1 hypothetical protein HS088_TW15G00106 [Tripterygium wilfordii]